MADNSILTRLDGLKLKYEEIGQKLTDPEVIADVKQFIQFNKEYRELEPIIEASERYRTAIANLAEAKDILANDKDEEMREMARGEIAELEPKIETLEEESTASARILTQAYTAVVCIAVLSLTGFPLVVLPNKNEYPASAALSTGLSLACPNPNKLLIPM